MKRAETVEDAEEVTQSVKCVAVAVPVYRSSLSDEERVSVRHLRRFLGENFSVYVFLPQSLANPLREFDEIRFPDRFFHSVETYSRLLLSEDFYRSFEAYEYLLIYQLDALVFSSELLDWCARGFDYIGAPWLTDPDRPERGFSRVGNGGLSLRRVSSFLEVMTSTRQKVSGLLLPRLLTTSIPDLRGALSASSWVKRAQILSHVRRGVSWYASNYTLNEDHFWADRACLFEPGFSVAPPEEALAFSFERAPHYCFERNHHRLPFGCHGWWRYGRDFWSPHLLAAENGG